MNIKKYLKKLQSVLLDTLHRLTEAYLQLGYNKAFQFKAKVLNLTNGRTKRAKAIRLKAKVLDLADGKIKL